MLNVCAMISHFNSINLLELSMGRPSIGELHSTQLKTKALGLCAAILLKPNVTPFFTIRPTICVFNLKRKSKYSK